MPKRKILDTKLQLYVADATARQLERIARERAMSLPDLIRSTLREVHGQPSLEDRTPKLALVEAGQHG